ncbi:marine proteobacterial sortase target protein [Thaumasiovibrio subtropicus]|uniref:marine proteobacterial sortase target protein n=1 Tax=Thaumasiovibrio subtropicus TaxID=1891207 RepID=UPI000B34D75C|nr:marine proteobacterial sortase target protein [Thaumasiovibrio subtropicus]
MMTIHSISANRLLLKLSRWVGPVVILMAISLSALASPHEEQRGLVYYDQQGAQTAPLLNTDVKMTISGLINRVTVKQTFTNSSDNWINGEYVFPLPDNAAVDQLRLWIGDRYIEGEIQPKAQARETFEQAKQAGKKASLVEQQRPNLFTTAVANVAPNETIIVEIEYQQSVKYEAGEFSLRFPSVVTPRYMAGLPTTPQQSDDTLLIAQHSEMPPLSGGWGIATPPTNKVNPRYRRDTDPVLPLAIKVDLFAGLPIVRIDSPNFKIKTKELNNFHYRVTLNDSSVADRDFVLRWRPAANQRPSAAYFQQNSAPDGKRYGLLMALPPQQEVGDSDNTQIGFEPIKQHMTFVLDISGSMHGESIKQAKAALLYGLDRLSTHDWFNIILFNHEAKTYQPQPLQATPEQIRRAKAFVNTLQADGGTEMSPALNLAFNQHAFPDALNQVVFITDGAVSNEQALFEQIQTQRNDRRLFTVGIGSAPNSYFMRRAATEGQGTYTYISVINDVDKQMRLLFDQISNPVMKDITLRWDDGSDVDYWPNPINDLYLQQPLQVTFTIPEQANILIVEGKQANRVWRHDVPVGAIRHEGATGLNVLWARNKIDSIELDPHLSKTDQRAKITNLGMTHHIVTAHTSLVAVDKTPSRPAHEEAKDSAVKSHLPNGMAAPVMAQTGNGSLLLMLIGGLISLCSGTLLQLARRQQRKEAK